MSVQHHIHLDFRTMPLDVDGAPPQRFTVIDLMPRPNIQINVARGPTGRTYVTRVVNTSNVPIVHQDVDLVLTCTAAEYDLLRTMLGEFLYYVPNDHVADGADHTDYLLGVVISEFNPAPIDKMLRKWRVEISLVDEQTSDIAVHYATSASRAYVTTSFPVLSGVPDALEAQLRAASLTSIPVMDREVEVSVVLTASSVTADDVAMPVGVEFLAELLATGNTPSISPIGLLIATSTTALAASNTSTPNLIRTWPFVATLTATSAVSDSAVLDQGA